MKKAELGDWNVVFKGKTFTVEQRKGVFEDGVEKIFERVKRNPTVEIIAFNEKQEILLNREYKMQVNDLVWRLPTGGVKTNEDPKNAAKRELMEEAGYEPQKIVLYREIKPMNSFVHTHYIYLMKDLIENKISNPEDKDIESKFFPLEEVYSMVKKEKIAGSETKQTICNLYWNKENINKYFEID